jgi:hypothetical protein
MSKPVEHLVEAYVESWQSVLPPNTAAADSVRGLAGLIEGFEKLRGQLAFEDEPSSFEAALQETKERST